MERFIVEPEVEYDEGTVYDVSVSVRVLGLESEDGFLGWQSRRVARCSFCSCDLISDVFIAWIWKLKQMQTRDSSENEKDELETHFEPVKGIFQLPLPFSFFSKVNMNHNCQQKKFFDWKWKSCKFERDAKAYEVDKKKARQYLKETIGKMHWKWRQRPQYCLLVFVFALAQSNIG